MSQKWLLLVGAGAAASVVATIVSVIVVGVVAFANVGLIAEALVGPDVTATLLQLFGNLVYAAIVGYAAASMYTQTFGRPSLLQLSLAIVGGIAALAFTFGSVPFLDSFAPFITEWLASLPELLAVAILALAFGACAAATVGLVGAAMPDPAVQE